MFSRTPSPNRKSLKSDRSPSPKSRNRLSPLFGRNSAPPSTESGSSDTTITKTSCPTSSSPKLFDKSERTFNIPASLVLQNNNINAKIGNCKEREMSPGKLTVSSSSKAPKEKTKEISNAENISSIPSPVVKPPRPAPRAINQHGNDIIGKSKGEGKQDIGNNTMIYCSFKLWNLVSYDTYYNIVTNNNLHEN